MPASAANLLPADSVVLLRHGHTPWNREGRLQGRQGAGLDALGRAQAAGLSAHLRAVRFAYVVSSPARRAVETCRLAGAADGASVDELLVERSWGRFEGMSGAEFHAALDGAGERFDERAGIVPGTIETVDAVSTRMRSWFEALPAGRVLAVTHGTAARLLMCSLAGVMLSAYRSFALDNCHAIVLDRSGAPQVTAVNFDLRAWSQA